MKSPLKNPSNLHQKVSTIGAHLNDGEHASWWSAQTALHLREKQSKKRQMDSNNRYTCRSINRWTSVPNQPRGCSLPNKVVRILNPQNNPWVYWIFFEFFRIFSVFLGCKMILWTKEDLNTKMGENEGLFTPKYSCTDFKSSKNSWIFGIFSGFFGFFWGVNENFCDEQLLEINRTWTSWETKTILVRIRLVAESVPCAIESIVDETGTENNKCRFCVIMAISLAETYDPAKCNFFDATQTSVKGFHLKWKNKILNIFKVLKK